MRVRRATPNDARAIAEVHVRTWQHAYAHVFPREFLDELSVDRRAEFWSESAAAAPEDLLVAEADERIVGFAAVGRAEDESDDVGQLYAIYVEPGYWGTGAGAALMDAAVTRLEAAGFAAAILWVLEDNPRARRFYERHGWTVDGSRRERIGDVEVDEVRYRLADLRPV